MSIKSKWPFPEEQPGPRYLKPRLSYLLFTAVPCSWRWCMQHTLEKSSFYCQPPSFCLKSSGADVHFQWQKKMEERKQVSNSRSRLTWSGGGNCYTLTQQHVCLRSSLSIRSSSRKIDLFSTWQLPSIRCEPWMGRHWRDQTGLLPVASTLSRTRLPHAGSVSPPASDWAALSGEWSSTTGRFL